MSESDKSTGTRKKNDAQTPPISTAQHTGIRSNRQPNLASSLSSAVLVRAAHRRLFVGARAPAPALRISFRRPHPYRVFTMAAASSNYSSPSSSGSSSKPRRKFIVDCDPGVDDAIALLMCVSECSRSDEDELLAVTTTHGNVGLEQTTLNACKVLDVLPAKNARFDARRVAIHKGCPGPLIASEKAYFPWHGVDGLGDAGLPDAAGRHVHDEHAALAIIRLCNEYPGEITLVCLGPLTTIALACRLDATLPSKVKELLWMGGTIQAKGNVSLTAEFNVHKDPEAAHIVLSAFLHSTMVSWETTEQHTVEWLVMEEFLAKAEASCSRLGAFLRGVTKPFVRDRERWTGALICDAVCMAAALDPSVVTEASTKFLDVELEGKYGRGMTVIDWEGRLSDRPPNVRIVERIDMPAFHAMLLRIVDTAARLKDGGGGGVEQKKT